MNHSSRILHVLLTLVVMPVLTFAQVGSIDSLEGSAKATGTNGIVRELVHGTGIYLNDQVATASDSRLVISLLDGTQVSMGEASEMTIDEYVIDSEKATGNRGSIKLVKGFFRMVTGKITKLNPEEFRVRTKVATIGIRGCDVGYEVTDETLNVVGMAFASGESAIVRRINPAHRAPGTWDGIRDGDWQPDPALWSDSQVLDRSGRMLTVHAITGIRELAIPPPVLRRLEPPTPAPARGGASGDEATLRDDAVPLDSLMALEDLTADLPEEVDQEIQVMEPIQVDLHDPTADPLYDPAEDVVEVLTELDELRVGDEKIFDGPYDGSELPPLFPDDNGTLSEVDAEPVFNIPLGFGAPPGIGGGSLPPPIGPAGFPGGSRPVGGMTPGSGFCPGMGGAILRPPPQP